MKTLIIYISLIFILVSNLSSQILNGYGIKAGMTSANQLFDYSKDFVAKDEKYNYRYGINFGLFAEFFEQEYFSLVVDLSYNQKGMVENFVATYFDTSSTGYSSYKKDLDTRFDYLTFSTNIKTRYKFENVSTYLITGFRYDILIGKKIEKFFNESGIRTLISDSFWDKYKGNIYGLTFGAGLEFNSLISFPIILEWVYNHDLTKIRMNEYLQIQNLSNELKVGIKF